MQATGLSAWAALSTSGLRTLELPAEIREVIVLADGDESGEAAALDAARAKSTFSAILRSLLGPNTAPLGALPREDRDLFIAANNGHVLAFDNVSGLPSWISDTLFRLATGGGFAVRQLYTDQDEVLFDAARPVILNRIEDIVTRPDLAERAIFLTLEPIPEERRGPEKELWAEFDAARPQLLGQPTPDGGLRTMGNGLRDRALAGGHLRGRLCRQPGRGRRQHAPCRGGHAAPPPSCARSASTSRSNARAAPEPAPSAFPVRGKTRRRDGRKCACSS
jgi:hypothetical protein